MMDTMRIVVVMMAAQDTGVTIGVTDLSRDPYWPVRGLVDSADEPRPDDVDPLPQQEDPEPHRPLDRDLIERLRLAGRSGSPHPLLTVRAQGWYMNPSGWLYITRGSRPGTATQMREGRDNHVDPAVATVLEGRLGIWGPHSVSLRAGSYDTSGTGTVSQDFIYHGRSFAAGRRVRTDFDFRILDLEYLYFWRVTPWLALTGHLGAEYWQFSGRVRTVDSGPFREGDREFSSGFWLAGIDGVIELSNPVAVRFLLLGGVEGQGRRFVEAEAGVLLRLGSGVSLLAGYRLHHVHFQQSTNESNLLFSGPTFGLEVGF